jgi:hypothetical protein
MATTRKRTTKSAGTRGRATGGRRGKNARAGSRKTTARRAVPGKLTARGRTTKRATTTTRRHTEQLTQEGLVTTDHNVIRRWVKERGGKPACVRGTRDANDVGLLRIDFPGYTGAETLQPISWDEFFDTFEQRKLAFLHRAQSHDGGRSYFNKLIERPRGRSAHRR